MAWFKIVKVEPIGTRSGPAFVHRTTGCNLETVTLPVYPESPLGERLRQERFDLGLGLREASRLLEITAEQLSGLEVGRYTLQDEYEWNVALTFLHAKAGG